MWPCTHTATDTDTDTHARHAAALLVCTSICSGRGPMECSIYSPGRQKLEAQCSSIYSPGRQQLECTSIYSGRWQM